MPFTLIQGKKLVLASDGFISLVHVVVICLLLCWWQTLDCLGQVRSTHLLTLGSRVGQVCQNMVQVIIWRLF